MEDKIEELAEGLRSAAFPAAGPWESAYGDVRERWIRAANRALSEVELCAKIAEDAAAELGEGAGEIYIARKIADRIRERFSLAAASR
jgi:hypothetical protein